MIKSFKAEIIAVGTELLLGQISNTNARWISEKLALLGINVYSHVVVGDNLNRATETFELAHKRSDIIIVTGGLGPTEDDLTREAFQQLSQLEMIEDKKSMDKIMQYFKKQNRQMTPNNKKQARVFKGSKVLENTVGMAPGMIVTFEERTWIFLPGVPREMKQLMSQGVLPYLSKLTGEKEKIQSLVLKFIGIGESDLEHKISNLIQEQSNPTIAPLAQNDGVVLRLTAKGSTNEKVQQLLEQTKQQILDRVGSEHLYGVNDETIEEHVISLLQEKNDRVAAAESLTGGMFTSKIISVKGASSVCPGGIVSYDPQVKANILGVPQQIIDTHGTVSDECAIEMARKVREKLNSTIGISFTGVAGPDKSEGKPVGTVFIGLSIKDGIEKTFQYQFLGDRTTVRYRAVLKGFEILLNYLKE